MILKPEKEASVPGSYRPISLLPTLGKLFEKIMVVRITKYMVNNNLINKYNLSIVYFEGDRGCAALLQNLSL